MTENLISEYLEGMKEIEGTLFLLGFQRSSFERRGFAIFTTYRNGGIAIDFLFGPSDWDVEMIIRTSNGKRFGFKDLLQIPSISNWVDHNRYVQCEGRDVRSELRWYLQLLKFALPIVE